MIHFEKYQGLGNDFIIPVGTLPQSLLPECGSGRLSPDQALTWSRLCDRRYGIGADGVLLHSKDAQDERWMHIINQDGSQAEMCGNGLRCFALHLARNSKVQATQFNIHTLAGLMKTRVLTNSVECHIGAARVQPISEITIGSVTVRGFLVSTGNPHFIIFDPYPLEFKREYAARIQKHSSFTNGVNVSFATMRHDTHINLEVYERGCGWTDACGTAATATAAAHWTMRPELYKHDAVKVTLPGGDLRISGTFDDMKMEGGADYVFSGTCAKAILA